MRKLFLSLLICTLILGSNVMVVNAEEYNMAEAISSTLYAHTKQVSVRLSITGKNASCQIRVWGENGTASISGVATLTNLTTGQTISSWNLSSNSSACASQKSFTLPKGYTYQLSFRGEVKTVTGAVEYVNGNSVASN